MNYPYANGYIKAIENKLLDRSKFAKLCKTAKEDFFGALLDMGYGTAGETVEELIESELSGLRKTIDELSPEKKYTDLFFLSFDCINIKAYYKMKLFAKADPEFYAKNGNLEKEALQKAIFSGDFSELPKTYQKFLTQLDASLQGTENPRTLSAAVDKAIYRFIRESLLLAPKPALKTYFTLSADLKNILSFIRSRKLGWEFPEFSEMFLESGKIPLSVFAQVYQKSDLELLRALRGYYDEKLHPGLKAYFENGDLAVLERFFDNFLIETMKPFRDDAFGIGVMFYYYLVKEAEAKNIKTIYASENPDLGDLIQY
ncbi:MAG TPA: V-type ATPase subunit [Acholeplasmataceae bacterium]|nr:V-type ATPase subunit [Acholeplasmataceae bacterium]